MLISNQGEIDQKWLRRARLYRGRLWRSLPFVAKNARKIMFFHMPKCAGTSLSSALYATIPLHKRIGVIDANATRLAAGVLRENTMDRLVAHEDLGAAKAVFALREQIALTHMCWGTPFIHGHLLWSDRLFEHFNSDYDFVSLLRHPIDRAISNFQMNVARGIVPLDMTIDQWLDGRLGFHHGSTYLRYFSGQADIQLCDAEKWLAIAKANAQKFTLIGSVEKQNQFRRAFHRIYGLSIKIPRYNNGAPSPSGLTKPQREKLAALCRFDIEFYESFGNWGVHDA